MEEKKKAADRMLKTSKQIVLVGNYWQSAIIYFLVF